MELEDLIAGTPSPLVIACWANVVLCCVVVYTCTLARKVQRRGRVYLSKRHVCFESERLNTRVIIPWKKVGMLSRTTCEPGPSPAILLKANNASDVRNSRYYACFYLFFWVFTCFFKYPIVYVLWFRKSGGSNERDGGDMAYGHG